MPRGTSVEKQYGLHRGRRVRSELRARLSRDVLTMDAFLRRQISATDRKELDSRIQLAAPEVCPPTNLCPPILH